MKDKLRGFLDQRKQQLEGSIHSAHLFLRRPTTRREGLTSLKNGLDDFFLPDGETLNSEVTTTNPHGRKSIQVIASRSTEIKTDTSNPTILIRRRYPSGLRAELQITVRPDNKPHIAFFTNFGGREFVTILDRMHREARISRTLGNEIFERTLAVMQALKQQDEQIDEDAPATAPSLMKLGRRETPSSGLQEGDQSDEKLTPRSIPSSSSSKNTLATAFKHLRN